MPSSLKETPASRRRLNRSRHRPKPWLRPRKRPQTRRKPRDRIGSHRRNDQGPEGFDRGRHNGLQARSRRGRRRRGGGPEDPQGEGHCVRRQEGVEGYQRGTGGGLHPQRRQGGGYSRAQLRDRLRRPHRRHEEPRPRCGHAGGRHVPEVRGRGRGARGRGGQPPEEVCLLTASPSSGTMR